jgi:hypothetical protein
VRYRIHTVHARVHQLFVYASIFAKLLAEASVWIDALVMYEYLWPMESRSARNRFAVPVQLACIQFIAC